MEADAFILAERGQVTAGRVKPLSTAIAWQKGLSAVHTRQASVGRSPLRL